MSGKRVIYAGGRPSGRMVANRGDRPPSAVLLFLRKNWKWLLLVLGAAALVMLVASD